MATTLSGWPTLDSPDWDDPRLGRLKIPGTPCVFYGRKDVAPYFVAFLIDYHRTIRALTKRDDVDAYDARPARAGGGRASDHYGGVAVDVLASGVGAQGSGARAFWLSKQNLVAALLSKYRLLYWGGDASIGVGEFRGQYHGKFIDPMHFYAKPGTDVAQFKAEIARMGIRPDGTSRPLSAHELHLLHLAQQGAKAPASTPTHLSPHQQHLLHLAQKPPAAQPVPTGAGPYWWLRFLRAHASEVGVFERAWWAIAMRESGGKPDCLYPSGAPWGDWTHGNGRHFDTGVLQVNDRHLDQVRAMFGASADMSAMLDPSKAWQFARKYLVWSDWGLVIAADGKSYRFDWSGWPSPYRPGESGAVEAEKSFAYWWNQYPVAVKKVYG